MYSRQGCILSSAVTYQCPTLFFPYTTIPASSSSHQFLISLLAAITTRAEYPRFSSYRSSYQSLVQPQSSSLPPVGVYSNPISHDHAGTLQIFEATPTQERVPQIRGYEKERGGRKWIRADEMAQRNPACLSFRR